VGLLSLADPTLRDLEHGAGDREKLCRTGVGRWKGRERGCCEGLARCGPSSDRAPDVTMEGEREQGVEDDAGEDMASQDESSEMKKRVDRESAEAGARLPWPLNATSSASRSSSSRSSSAVAPVMELVVSTDEGLLTGTGRGGG